MSADVSPTDARRERKERYERVIRVVRRNANECQTTGISHSGLLGILYRADVDIDDAKKSIKAAADNGAIVAVGVDGRRNYLPHDEARLVRMLNAEVDSDELSKARLGAINQALQVVRS